MSPNRGKGGQKLYGVFIVSFDSFFSRLAPRLVMIDFRSLLGYSRTLPNELRTFRLRLIDFQLKSRGQSVIISVKSHAMIFDISILTMLLFEA